MARGRKNKPADQHQEGLPHIPQPAAPPPRKIIPALEKMCLDKDELCEERSGISQKINTKDEDIEAKMVELGIGLYTFKNAAGILQDVELKKKITKRKSDLNPKPKKKGDE